MSLGPILTGRLAASLSALDVPGDAPLGVACSGGADSVALTHLLAASRSRLVVLHVDHGLRDGSASDAGFVMDLAAGLALEADVERVVVVASGSTEAAAREARYAALSAMAQRHGLAFVATAHTTDDQAETVLLRAMRGGSLDAIAPRRGMFVRPLLGVRGAELRAWLAEGGIAWLEDPTNTDIRFERNWVRHVLLPQLRERRAGVDIALSRVADHERVDRHALDEIAAAVLHRARVDDVGVLVAADDLAGAPLAIARRVIRGALERLGESPSAVAVDAIARMRVGQKCVGRQRVGVVDVQALDIGLAFTTPTNLAAVQLPSTGTVTDEARGLRLRVGSAAGDRWRWRTPVPAGPQGALSVRTRRPGDRIGSRKVQDVLVDAKVPRPLRDLVGIVATDTGALAVVGHAASRHPMSSDIVVDVEPVSSSWSRELVWRR